MKKTICIFPNDPIKSYLEKGEIKNRYFNPANLFTDVHIISLTDDEVKEHEVQTIAGNAKLTIHKVGKIKIKKRKEHVEELLEIVREIKPDVIRAYNSRLEGWFAANCAQQLQIPFFLSLHTQMDYNRALAKKTNLKKFLSLKYLEKFVEPFVINQADKITIVYKVIEPYVLKKGGKTPELLYNRINLETFSNGKQLENISKPLVLSVGNLIKEKNHECVIKAMKDLDAKCIIIGKGYDYERLQKIISEEKLENKISIIQSVPHNQIQDYYSSANVFALAYNPELEGLPIPVMEAMASGLPIVIPFQKEGFSDKIEKAVLFSERNSSSFHNNIKKILNDQEFYQKLSIQAKDKAKDFDEKKIEIRESEIYNQLIGDYIKKN